MPFVFFQFLYVSKRSREEIAAEVYEDEVDLRRSHLNSSFTSAWSERSVDPDDFRVNSPSERCYHFGQGKEIPQGPKNK